MLPAIGSAGLSVDDVATRLAETFGDDLVNRVSRGPTPSSPASSAAACTASPSACARSTASPTSRATSSPRSTRATASRAVYHLYSYASNTYLELHVDVPRGKPAVATVSDVWPAADWHEREA